MCFVLVGGSNAVNECCLRRTKLLHSWRLPAAFFPSKSHHYMIGAHLTSVFVFTFTVTVHQKNGSRWWYDLGS